MLLFCFAFRNQTHQSYGEFSSKEFTIALLLRVLHVPLIQSRKLCNSFCSGGLCNRLVGQPAVHCTLLCKSPGLHTTHVNNVNVTHILCIIIRIKSSFSSKAKKYVLITNNQFSTQTYVSYSRNEIRAHVSPRSKNLLFYKFVPNRPSSSTVIAQERRPHLWNELLERKQLCYSLVCSVNLVQGQVQAIRKLHVALTTSNLSSRQLQAGTLPTQIKPTALIVLCTRAKYTEKYENRDTLPLQWWTVKTYDTYVTMETTIVEPKSKSKGFVNKRMYLSLRMEFRGIALVKLELKQIITVCNSTVH